jgi:hypothetical protein
MMFNENDYDLSRLRYREWNEQFKNQYVPVKDGQPNIVQRLHAALSRWLARRTTRQVLTSRQQRVNHTAVAK